MNKENRIKNYVEIFEAQDIIYKYEQYYSKDKALFFSKIKDYKTVNNENFSEKNIINTINILREKSKKKVIIPEDNLIINTNDFILIENKREYPKNFENEINNFIEHLFYFMILYKNLKLLNEESEIHLLFVYDHSRNYRDQKKAYIQLNLLIEKNSLKFKQFSNNIRFYLIHSLPNLGFSVFDRIEKKKW